MKPNRLINQKSPYLLQHAHNPVDWYPWGDEAFKRARDEDKPVFLSIGYSTCHWCHVMERESFEDKETAEIMNNVFVCIKVDREEHPDVDEMFMTACNMITGSGGWPLSVFLTPDMVPFFAATYIPRESSFGRTGLKDIAGRVLNLWSSSRETIMESANSVKQALAGAYRTSNGARLTAEDLRRADDKLKSRYDDENGGFLPYPKFPMPHSLMYLMKRYRETGDRLILEMALETLRFMRSGGIWDHVGLGFHRYSTDSRWFLPHFEKMLYDQALCAFAYLDAFDITKEDYFKDTACEIIDYVMSCLTSPGGGFYSAEDADSEGEEGRFYTWEYSELEGVLTSEDMTFLENTFGISKNGNFKDEASGKNSGRNILAIKKERIKDHSFNSERFEPIRRILLEKRGERVRPFLDRKIIVSWNGLMIMALSYGFRLTGKKLYLDEAMKAADFIKKNMFSGKGRLSRGGMDIYDSLPAVSQDYAHLITGLIHLGLSSGRNEYLEWAGELQDVMISDFFDNEYGIFRMASGRGVLCVNPFDMHDSAIPSANSSAVFNLRKLSELTGRKDWAAISEKLEISMAGSARKWPDGFTWFLNSI